MTKAFLTVLIASLALSACGPSYVRGSDEPELDKAAMSTGLDKVDLERLFKENADSLFSSPIFNRWRNQMAQGQDNNVAILAIRNETTEHVSSQVAALLSKFETDLINSGVVTVISHERQLQLLEELGIQADAAFDASRTAQLGHQLGAQYFITGKIYDAAEKTGDERRVQYFLFMQCIEVETGAIRWQHESNLTKGLIN